MEISFWPSLFHIFYEDRHLVYSQTRSLRFCLGSVKRSFFVWTKVKWRLYEHSPHPRQSQITWLIERIHAQKYLCWTVGCILNDWRIGIILTSVTRSSEHVKKVWVKRYITDQNETMGGKAFKWNPQVWIIRGQDW